MRTNLARPKSFNASKKLENYSNPASFSEGAKIYIEKSKYGVNLAQIVFIKTAMMMFIV